jgi:putative flippase GtrA
MLNKKGIIASLLAGEIASWFLISIIKNPFIPEFEALAALGPIIWLLPIVLPILFLTGIVIAWQLGRIAKVFLQFARFAEIGVLNAAIDFGVLNLLIAATGVTSGATIIVLNVISVAIATTNSYFWNRWWTFDAEGGAAGKEFAQFVAVSFVGVLINSAIVFLGTSLIDPQFGLSAGLWANLMKVVATVVSLVWNFMGYKFIVFKR